MSGVLLATLCVTSIIFTVSAHPNPPTICNMSYHLRWQFYQSCFFQSDVPYPPVVGNQFTGNDVIGLLTQLCIKSTDIKQCMASDLTECSERVKDVVSSATDRTTGFCGPDGNVSAEVTQIFQEEETSATLEDKDTARCHEGVEIPPCVDESKEKSGLATDRRFTQTTEEFFADDAASGYFRYFFQCLHQKVAENCPSNAMTMTIGLVPSVFVFPRFGINMATIWQETVKAES